MKKLLIPFVVVFSLNAYAFENYKLEGNGTANDPFLVTSADDLSFIANKVNSADESYTKAYYLQTNNIVINAQIGDEESYSVWTPIGTAENPFQGVYNGGRNTISGIYINDSNAEHQGIFGCNDGEIKYLGLTNSYINARTLIGGICGENRGDISFCHNEGTIVGVFYVGGICGENNLNVQYCYNIGNIHGAGPVSCVGGIAGTNIIMTDAEGNTSEYNACIQNCYNAGNISCTESTYVGGICGMDNYGIIKYCYNSGIVSGYAISSQYYISDELFYDNQICNSTDPRAIPLPTANMTKTALFSDDNWEFVDGYYPQLKNIKTDKSTLYAIPIFFAEGETANNIFSNFKVPVYNGLTWSCKNGLLEFNSEGDVSIISTGEEVITMTYGEYSREIAVTICSEPNINGVGTKENPYLISSIEDFFDIANKINSDVPAYDKLCYKVTKTLTFNTNLNKKISNGETEDLVEWTPIKKFSGTFDFSWNFVEGLYINNNEPNQALFAHNEGEIHSTYIVNSYVRGKTDVAAICAENHGLIKYIFLQNSTVRGISDVAGICANNYGEIQKSINSATIIGDGAWYTAGICAASYKSGSVINCINEGSIKGQGRMAGICAYAYGKIEQCTNIGSINEENHDVPYVAGICAIGGLSSIERCVNGGLVSGSSYSGGIAGIYNMGSIKSCINIGTIIGNENEQCGTIMGQYEGTVENCYFDKQISGIKDEHSFANGLTTEEMTSGNLFNDETHWIEAHGRYPELSEVGSYIPVVFLADGEDVYSIKSNFRVDATREWTSANNKISFDKEGNATICSTGEDYIISSKRKIPVKILENPNITSITMNQYGSATYCSQYALDFSEVQGLKAYAATGYNSKTGVITLTRVMTAKAGMGLFIKGEPGEYSVPELKETDDNSLNMLVGTLEKTTVNSISDDGKYYNYRYTTKTGNPTPSFYKIADGHEFSAGKAYLQIPVAWRPEASEARNIILKFDDGNTTDIEEANSTPEETTYYDLMGRKVKNPQKGVIYIVNGKKTILN